MYVLLVVPIKFEKYIPLPKEVNKQSLPVYACAKTAFTFSFKSDGVNYLLVLHIKASKKYLSASYLKAIKLVMDLFLNLKTCIFIFTHNLVGELFTEPITADEILLLIYQLCIL